MFTKAQYQQSFRVVKSLEQEIRETVHSQMRGAALLMANRLFNEEVQELCGPVFSRKEENQCHRTGSDPGSVIIHGQKVKVRKPRVRRDEDEVELQTYSALQSYIVILPRSD